MTKIFLVNPHSPSFLAVKERNIPLGLLYLSSFLKKSGHQVRFKDIHNDQITCEINKTTYSFPHYYDSQIRKIVEEFKPDLVGISVHFSGRFKPAIELAQRLKKEEPELPVAIGGIHPSIFPREILEEYTCFDYLFQGESEESLVQLANSFEDEKYDFRSIDGLGYRENGKIVINDKRNFIDNVDTIPFPDYNLIDLEDYYFDTSKWVSPKKLPINTNIHILSSRSCPRQCTYCSMFLALGPKYRMRSADNVVNEIEYLYNKFNHKYFSFMDDNFTLNKKRAIEICNKIVERGLNIQFDSPNGLDVNTLDEELFEALVAAGLVRTCLAIESGSPEIRRSVNKNLTQKKIYEVYESIRKFPQLVFNSFFIVGFPLETKETLEETYKLIKDLKLSKAIISFATPFPGTELYRECVDNNLIDVDLGEGLHNINKFFYASNTPFIKPYKLKKQDLIDFRLKIYEELHMDIHLKALELIGEEKQA